MNQEDLLSDANFFKSFKSGEELNGFFQKLYKQAVEQMLEGELDAHLGYEKHEKAHQINKQNGYSKKQIKSSFGEAQIKVPRDRKGDFEPMLVPKGHNILEGLENVVISLYAKGMSIRDIEEQIREVYGFDISSSTISRITDSISKEVTLWQNRPLDSIYLVVWMDRIIFKVRQDSKVIPKTIYLALGLNQEGKKEILGMWLGQKESASFWMSVLTDLKVRGVDDILITVTDNLKGFQESIACVFPQAQKQICVVHQIRNAAKTVVWKDRKEFFGDMRTIYKAPNQESAWLALEQFDLQWGKKYPHAIRSWKNKWSELSTFFEFPVEIRNLIYTTNPIENLNKNVRKYTNAKLSFPTDEALLKSVFLALKEINKKAYKSIKNNSIILNQFMIMFEDRLS